MTIYFGLGLDNDIQIAEKVQAGIHYVGANRMLAILETQMGFQGYPSGNEHLRIEQYRQALTTHLEEYPESFYRNSFLADQMATATEMLSRRDELLLSGWDFEHKSADLPARLAVLGQLEALIFVNLYDEKLKEDYQITLSPGFSDRFQQILRHVEKRKNNIEQIYTLEPSPILPNHFQRLFECLKKEGTKVESIPQTPINGDSDLANFQTLLLPNTPRKKHTLKQDGSLLLLQCKRETDGADYLAKLLRKNPNWKPHILMTEKNRTLDTALIQEGLPSMGILSASLARPMLQIIKLAPTFLWNPIDPFKLMEFVNLKVKPLEEELSNRIAQQLAQAPGIGGEGWAIMLKNYFDEIEAKAQNDSYINAGEIRQQYNFWFRRDRYSTAQRVPIEEVIEIYNYLKEWSFQAFEDSGNRSQSLLVLSEQAKRIEELLNTLPESALSYLELERIIRTIYEPSPVAFRAQEVGFYPFVHHPTAFLHPVDELIWWNFSQSEPNHFFSRWYKKERAYLEQQHITLETPKEENARLIWQRSQPILHAKNQVILLMPEQVEGKKVHLHPLYSDLQAAFGDLEAISLNIDEPEGQTVFEAFFQLPRFEALESQQLGYPKPFFQIQNLQEYLKVSQETYTSLDSLFYYPYQWILRYKTRLKKSSILSVVKDNTLLGNLAHRFFERLLKQEKVTDWSKEQIENWIDEQAKKMFGQEGAVLLMYGREPDKINFLNRLKYASWSLISCLHNNGWQVKDTEMNLEGQFEDAALKAKADLVLQRGEELAIIDLKWRGLRYRESLIKNQEDLQLVLYSKLIGNPTDWAHTSYFIIEKGKMIARNNQAFQEVDAIDTETGHAEMHDLILSRMNATYHWRRQQIEKGLIEVRCEQTVGYLQEAFEAYGLEGESMDLLEMKSRNAPFDDYRVLINLIS
ncbi:MAG: PD-(D/E)XK nuclease family protein [Bacteroidota bacterium]